MCVICYTKDNQISDDDIKLMFKANKDGAGFAYIGTDGFAYYSKGFMKVESLISALPDDRRWLMLHFRIATRGEIVPAMTHPFNISESNMELQGATSRLLFHNGIIPVNWKVNKQDKKNLSDTFLFVRDILTFTKNSRVVDFMLTSGYGNKFAYYNKNNNKNWILYGEWKKYHNMQVSNLAFESAPLTTVSGFKVGYLDYSDRSMYDNYDGDISGLSEPIESLDDAEKCAFCRESLGQEDKNSGICSDCTIEHGLFCDICQKRLVTHELVKMICDDCENYADVQNSR